ncbi:hypothetical protein DO97_10475 [Neosynechococcus sphagnicola sy1]|uniref:Uncharacterized protein n=1 Tax=Neosynechococcus sphagnicola sy1 TaxID=1497020 RepID=A0A098TNE8_9CYAN|nr:hypothetical protein [Neosynechococcus sphagnicola]KGF73819.1 hypothetical protein DO97_10475 [Neosynechococcus sphagnicola sy1]
MLQPIHTSKELSDTQLDIVEDFRDNIERMTQRAIQLHELKMAGIGLATLGAFAAVIALVVKF